jgi:alpha-beta hydrolase superfamily lysophospholipase
MTRPGPIPFAAAAMLVMLATAAAAQYAVGTADRTFVDPDRDDRPVPVDLYYPAESAGPGQPVAEPPPGGFGTVSFGHGYLLSSGLYAWVAERLASIGCVVAVPRTGGELFPDHAVFALDLAFAARTVRDAGQDPASPFFGRMSPRTLVMGHSMGGGCSFLAAAGDPSLTAVANLAAAETDPSAIAACGQLAVPALLFAGTNDCVTPPPDHQIPMYGALAGGWRTLVTITGASHCQFNAESFLCELGEACSPDISRQVQQDRVWLLLEPWVRAVLLQEAGAAAEFQLLLASGGGFTYEQEGGLTDAPPSSAADLTVTAHPNPFNPATEIRVTVAEGGPVSVSVHDLRGRRLRTLFHGHLNPGRHDLRWDGRDGAGRELPAGVYLARAAGRDATAGCRLALVR